MPWPVARLQVPHSHVGCEQLASPWPQEFPLPTKNAGAELSVNTDQVTGCKIIPASTEHGRSTDPLPCSLVASANSSSPSSESESLVITTNGIRYVSITMCNANLN